jgi:hypothetical protein
MTTTEDKTEALAGLTHFAKIAADAQERVHAHVIIAKMSGASWAEIGAILGTSKQAAQQRYGSAATDAKTDVGGQAARQAVRPANTAGGRAVRKNETTTIDVPGQMALELEASKPVDADPEQAERDSFWEAKRRYAVTVCGAIYAPQGENGWKLEEVLTNVYGKNHPRTFAGMTELYENFGGVLFINREHRAGLIRNAAKDREVWMMAATNTKENSVTANVEVTRKIDAMRDELARVDAALKATRKRKPRTTAAEA